MTNVMLDGSDFYIETLNEDSTKYLFNGEWKDLIIKQQKIATKEGDTIVLPLKFTHRGPIISKFKNLNKAVSMRWIGYEFSNELKGIYLLNKAHNWNDFLQACKNFGAVSQNIVFADYQGNIGIKLTGLVPIRKTAGYFLFRGDTSEFDWNGFVNFDSLPVIHNPECGYVVSANNKSSNDVDFYISQYYYPDYRYNRIADLLSQNDSIDVNYMAMVQTDQYSVLAKKITPIMLDFFSKNPVDIPEYQEVINKIQSWNYVLNANSVAALFFEQFNIFLVKNSVQDELGNDLFAKFDNLKILMNNMIENLWLQKYPELYDNISTPEKETFDDIMKISFIQTIDTLKKQLGNNVENWQYGRLHTFTLHHPLAKVKILNKLFNLNKGTYAVGGSNHTVSPYSYSYDNNFKVSHGASQRHIFDFGDWNNSFTVIPTGESGVPTSDFYCDQTEMYVADKYHKDIFDLQSVIENAKFKMKFSPQK
jgi:penicillin amidase